MKFNPTLHTGLFHLALLSACLCSFAVAVSAQSPNNPPMASAQLEGQKEELYARWNDYKRNPNPEQQRFAYPTAKEYLRRWGGDDSVETREVRKWVIQYERAMHQQTLYAAYDAKEYAKTISLAQPMVKSDPEYFFAWALMTKAGYDNLLAGDRSLNADTANAARRALALLDAGKVSKADPFTSIDAARGFLNLALGNVVRDEKPAEAAAAFSRAVKTETYRTDPVAYHRLAVAILKGDFAEVSNEYNQKFGGKEPSAEQAAMLNRLTHLADQAIDAFARAVALLDKPEQKNARAQALTQLTTLYKSFHNNSDAGLNELIAGVLSKPMP